MRYVIGGGLALVALVGAVFLGATVFAPKAPPIQPVATEAPTAAPATTDLAAAMAACVTSGGTFEVTTTGAVCRSAAQPTQTVVVNPTAPVVVLNQSSGSSSWTPEVKCEWLRSNFPQTTEAVQALGAQLANVQLVRVRTHLYPCSSTVTVFDGFIVLGPNEGYSGEVSMTVPPHGAIDSYVGASFSGRNQQIGEDTVRGFDGTVTGVSMTYWPWLDEDPPNGGTSLVPSVTGCIQPQELARQENWKEIEWADQKYGGLRIELTTVGQLPPMWEALASGRAIKENDSNREMVAAFWTIYPPFSCREQLGFSK